MFRGGICQNRHIPLVVKMYMCREVKSISYRFILIRGFDYTRIILCKINQAKTLMSIIDIQASY